MKFWQSTSLLNSVSGQNSSKMDLQVPVWIIWNSGSPEYHFSGQLSQLSDGPLNGSKRLAICELQQSESWLVAESAFLGRLFLQKSGFWWNFAMTSPEILYTKNFTNELNFLLVTHMSCFNIWFGRYSISKSGSSSGQILDRMVYRCFIRFLGHKMSETH
jgi:hypothetical protein